MTDQNMADFYSRVRRYETMRSKGFAHEATGALGRSFYYGTAKPVRRRAIVGPILFAISAALLLKASIFYTVGPQDYTSRVARLEAGQGFDQLGAWLMQPEPVTEYLSHIVGQGVGYLKR
jgi:hypothetical protein